MSLRSVGLQMCIKCSVDCHSILFETNLPPFIVVQRMCSQMFSHDFHVFHTFIAYWRNRIFSVLKFTQNGRKVTEIQDCSSTSLFEVIIGEVNVIISRRAIFILFLKFSRIVQCTVNLPSTLWECPKSCSSRFIQILCEYFYVRKKIGSLPQKHRVW